MEKELLDQDAQLRHKKIILLCLSLLFFSFASDYSGLEASKKKFFTAALNDDQSFFKIDVFSKKANYLIIKHVVTAEVFLWKASSIADRTSTELFYSWFPGPHNRNPHRILIVGSLSPPYYS